MKWISSSYISIFFSNYRGSLGNSCPIHFLLKSTRERKRDDAGNFEKQRVHLEKQKGKKKNQRKWETLYCSWMICSRVVQFLTVEYVTKQNLKVARAQKLLVLVQELLRQNYGCSVLVDDVSRFQLSSLLIIVFFLFQTGFLHSVCSQRLHTEMV